MATTKLTQVGKRIVNDSSLIFYYDATNKIRSFKGKPTTNLFAEDPNVTSESTRPPSATAGDGFSQWNYTGTDYVAFLPDRYIKLREQNTTGGHYIFLDSQVVANTAHTMSVYAKPVEQKFIQLAPSTGFTGNAYANFKLEGEGSITGTGASNATIKLIKSGRNQGWYRCTYTATSSGVTGNGRMVLALVNSTSAGRLQSYTGTATHGVYITDPQFEASSFATPFVDGTRSTSQAIIDLKGGHEITVKDLTYPVDNRGFNFSSTTSRLDIESSALSTQASSGIWTVEMWLKRTALSSGDIDTFLQTGSGNNFLWYFRQTTGNIEFENTAKVTWSFTPATDVYYHFVATGTGGTVEVFINGVSLGTNAATTTFSIAYANGICVGQELDSNTTTPSVDPNQRFQGEIPLVRFYSRVLSEGEVKQNFIAHRNQFGL